MGHNHDLRLSRLQVESSRVEHTRSLAAFLPAVSASCGIQYNYGRSVSSETNTYENVSTFANSWAAQMSMPLFDGGYLLAGYRRSRLALAQSTEALEQARQELALQVVQQYIDVVYYDCLSGIMQQKLSDTDTLLNISRVKAELGLLSESELVQMQAQRATDDYNLAHVRSQCRQSLIALFTSMNYMPVEADTAVLSSFTLEFQTYDSCRLACM
ncbi:MAG: TolC family protein, partial [Bacteroidaceae bacterium]|nr:TolC family protein [Bacteroidaceae bacterium]